MNMKPAVDIIRIYDSGQMDDGIKEDAKKCCIAGLCHDIPFNLIEQTIYIGVTK